MPDWEKALVLALEGFASSGTGRFVIQLLILLVMAVVAGIIIYDRYVAMRHRRTQEAAEDFNIALDAKDRVNDGLDARVAGLEIALKDAREREERLIARIDRMRDRHDAEMEGIRRAFETRIADLEARLESFECVKAPTCKNRRKPGCKEDVKIGGTDA